MNLWNILWELAFMHCLISKVMTIYGPSWIIHLFMALYSWFKLEIFCYQLKWVSDLSKPWNQSYWIEFSGIYWSTRNAIIGGEEMQKWCWIETKSMISATLLDLKVMQKRCILHMHHQLVSLLLRDEKCISHLWETLLGEITLFTIFITSGPKSVLKVLITY